MINTETYPAPTIPQELDHLWAGNIPDTHQAFARLSLADVRRDMATVTPPQSNKATAYVDLSPTEDHDPTSAVVVPLDFGCGWSPAIALRTQLLQAVLPEPRRVIVIPNNAIGEVSSYAFDKQEQHKVASIGDLSPLAKRISTTLSHLEIKQVDLVGYSQGAAVGAAVWALENKRGARKLGTAGLFEAPNAVERTPMTLLRDFLATKGFDAALQQSALPAFDEIYHMRGGADTLYRLANDAKYAGGVLLSQNRALVRGLAHRQFWHDVDDAVCDNPDTRIAVVGARDSSVFPQSAMRSAYATAESYPEVRAYQIYRYGHELVGNVAAYALLGLAVLTRQGIQQ